MNFAWFVGLICLSSVTVNSQPDLFRQPKRDTKRKFCGKFLSDTLALVCEGNYNLWYNPKKDVPYNDMQNEDYAYDQFAEEPKWPFLSRQSANSLLSRNDYHRRFRRGVIDECCKKSCTMKELQTYCAKDNRN